MQGQPEVSLTEAFKFIWRSALFWPVLLLVAVVSAAQTLLPSNGVWGLVSFAASIFLIGYEVSVARAVFDGAVALPSPLVGFGRVIRRGVSAVVIIAVPVLLGLLALLVVSLLFRPTIGGGAWYVTTAFTVVLLALFIPFFLSTLARFVGLDSLREGFRYRRAFAEFRAHIHAGGQVIGYFLIAAFLITGIRYVVLSRFGLFSLSPSLALAKASHGSLRRGLLLVGLELLLAAVSALWELISAALVGQFATVAYGEERASSSV